MEHISDLSIAGPTSDATKPTLTFMTEIIVYLNKATYIYMLHVFEKLKQSTYFITQTKLKVGLVNFIVGNYQTLLMEQVHFKP